MSGWVCRAARVCRAVLFVGTAALLLAGSPRPAEAQPQGVASVIVDLRTNATLTAERADLIDRPVLPGSVMKITAVAAALESGVITPRTTIVCTRTVVVDGHQLTCTHPDLRRPLTAAEALTHSCNVFVATVTGRLSRTAFDTSLTSLGLPPSDPAASVRAAALGLEGRRMTPRVLMAAVARVAGVPAVPAWRPSTVDTVRAGLRGAAHAGTAAALDAAGIDALAKTGTVGVGRVSQGLVVGVTPSGAPTMAFALLVSGGAGMDAASLVATRLRAAMQRGLVSAGAARDAAAVRTLRIGVATASGGYAVKDMALDEYVAGVIAGEAESASAPAALEALAIAARTYALANVGRHAGDGFDLCDLTHCQVHRRPTRASTAASAATAGTYLSSAGRVAEVYYTAACGGHTEKPSAVWRGATDAPHLPSRADEACAGEPAWSSEIGARDLLHALRAGGFSGETIRGVTVIGRTGSGRAAWLRVDGLTPAEVSGENLRTLVGRTLGWQYVRSTLFEVTRTASGYRFAGRGAGHGVGLCVLGAAQRARHGADAAAILREYYPGLELRTLAADTRTVRVVLPVEQEASRRDVTALAERSLADVSARLGATATATVHLRFHPTVESYQRATGQPWFTSASTRGDVVELLPLPVLRERRLLEATLRHELAHVLTARALGGAPRWMSEGVAVWAERGAATAAAAAGTACPADAEFGRAASADALRRVYDRAAACYARELQRGRSWRTLDR